MMEPPRQMASRDSTSRFTLPTTDPLSKDALHRRHGAPASATSGGKGAADDGTGGAGRGEALIKGGKGAKEESGAESDNSHVCDFSSESCPQPDRKFCYRDLVFLAAYTLGYVLLVGLASVRVTRGTSTTSAATSTLPAVLRDGVTMFDVKVFGVASLMLAILLATEFFPLFFSGITVRRHPKDPKLRYLRELSSVGFVLKLIMTISYILMTVQTYNHFHWMSQPFPKPSASAPPTPVADKATSLIIPSSDYFHVKRNATGARMANATSAAGGVVGGLAVDFRMDMRGNVDSTGRLSYVLRGMRWAVEGLVLTYFHGTFSFDSSPKRRTAVPSSLLSLRLALSFSLPLAIHYGTRLPFAAWGVSWQLGALVFALMYGALYLILALKTRERREKAAGREEGDTVDQLCNRVLVWTPTASLTLQTVVATVCRLPLVLPISPLVSIHSEQLMCTAIDVGGRLLESVCLHILRTNQTDTLYDEIASNAMAIARSRSSVGGSSHGHRNRNRASSLSSMRTNTASVSASSVARHRKYSTPTPPSFIPSRTAPAPPAIETAVPLAAPLPALRRPAAATRDSMKEEGRETPMGGVGLLLDSDKESDRSGGVDNQQQQQPPPPAAQQQLESSNGLVQIGQALADPGDLRTFDFSAAKNTWSDEKFQTAQAQLQELWIQKEKLEERAQRLAARREELAAEAEEQHLAAALAASAAQQSSPRAYTSPPIRYPPPIPEDAPHVVVEGDAFQLDSSSASSSSGTSRLHPHNTVSVLRREREVETTRVMPFPSRPQPRSTHRQRLAWQARYGHFSKKGPMPSMQGVGGVPVWMMQSGVDRWRRPPGKDRDPVANFVQKRLIQLQSVRLLMVSAEIVGALPKAPTAQEQQQEVRKQMCDFHVCQQKLQSFLAGRKRRPRFIMTSYSVHPPTDHYSVTAHHERDVDSDSNVTEINVVAGAGREETIMACMVPMVVPQGAAEGSGCLVDKKRKGGRGKSKRKTLMSAAATADSSSYTPSPAFFTTAGQDTHETSSPIPTDHETCEQDHHDGRHMHHTHVHIPHHTHLHHGHHHHSTEGNQDDRAAATNQGTGSSDDNDSGEGGSSGSGCGSSGSQTHTNTSSDSAKMGVTSGREGGCESNDSDSQRDERQEGKGGGE
ncbi:unnamed protein product [Vitrella brassicaformis CCMP3155]|uniref:Transmembrane protein n=4 Tax=Vitrella brassicaformis TaxID=1169539 RepID=A0A0G4F1H3_VITBC|nr:unnamed protein product [Vitrella brassicaformis CCMP3155]|eukprot:CEM05436.1 unnamed protein product [Vitrella brassicaformis CCMP3155]